MRKRISLALCLSHDALLDSGGRRAAKSHVIRLQGPTVERMMMQWMAFLVTRVLTVTGVPTMYQRWGLRTEMTLLTADLEEDPAAVWAWGGTQNGDGQQSKWAALLPRQRA